MSDDAIRSYQEAAITGHRPTWPAAERSRGSSTAKRRSSAYSAYSDSFGLFDEAAEEIVTEPPRRTLRNAERKSLAALNLDESATAEQIKTRYKELVKRLHPDANGGDRSLEDKLRDIINAYNYLRSVGFC